MPRTDAVPLLPALLLVVPLASAAPQLPSGSVVVRSPNMFTGWITDPGTIQFNFLHRFTESGPPEHQISNSPTFFVATGLPARTTVGFDYSTSSDVAPGRPNEWEFFGRVMPFRPGNPVADVTLHVGRNVGAASTDGEIGLARSLGPLRFLAAGRAFSNAYRAGERRAAVAGGTTIRLTRWLAAAGDVSSLTDRRAGERIAWSGGLQFGIPTTPHSFSIQATNANTGTLEGSSRGTPRTRWGFEYTVPITLARYIPALRPHPAAVAQAADSAPNATPSTAAASAPNPTSAPGAPNTPARDTSATRDTSVTRDSAPARDTASTSKPAPAPAAAPAPSATSAPSAEAPGTPRRAARPTGAAGGAATARHDTVRTRMRQIQFAPARIDVQAGTTVVWLNDDPLQHSVVADGGGFDSGLIDPGKRWAHTFTKPGTYTFHCTPHPFMKGIVVVH
jgi:plastocyanin